MSLIANKKIFLINSRDRASGSDSDFIINLDIQPGDDFDFCCVLQASIPKSYYMVGDGESFRLTENGSSVQVSLPRGNYNRTSFRAKIQQKLNSLSPNGWIYNVTNPNAGVEPDDGKYTWTVTGNGASQPSFTFTTQLFEQMGFNRNTTNVFTDNSLVSANVIKLQEDTLFLHSSIVDQSANNNVLQEFYTVSTPTFASIHFDNFSGIEAYSKPMTKGNQNSFNFYLSDEDGQRIQLNGLNMQLTLLLYKRDNIWELLRRFIGLVTSKLM